MNTFTALPAKVAPYFERHQPAAPDRRDCDGAPGGSSCTRRLFPCSDSLGSSGSGRNFRRESSGSVLDSAAGGQAWNKVSNCTMRLP